jgi:hypothetical protein
VYRYPLVIPSGAVAMQDADRAMRARLGRLAEARPGLVARLQLFGLLLLLVPLFAGLQYVVGEGASRVEIRFVSQDVPVIVPVERIVERVVERIIYVPVPAEEVPDAGPTGPTPTVLPSGTPTPSGAAPGDAGAPSAGATGPVDADREVENGAVPGGLTAAGAGGVGPGPGLPAPALPAGAVSAAPIVQIAPGLPGLAAGPPESAGASAPRRAATPAAVLIATEDRLGVPAAAGPAHQQEATATPRETQQRDGNGDDAQHAAGAPAVQPGSAPAATGARERAVAVPSAAAGASRQPTIPAPVGVKPPPEN